MTGGWELAIANLDWTNQTFAIVEVKQFGRRQGSNLQECDGVMLDWAWQMLRPRFFRVLFSTSLARQILKGRKTRICNCIKFESKNSTWWFDQACWSNAMTQQDSMVLPACMMVRIQKSYSNRSMAVECYDMISKTFEESAEPRLGCVWDVYVLNDR